MGFGEGEGAQGVTACRARQVTPAQRVIAAEQDRIRGEKVCRQHRYSGSAGCGNLFHRQRQSQRRDAGAAPLYRQVYPQNAQRSKLVDILAGESGIFVDVLRSRSELASSE
jgi:hypothetical protein